MKKLFKNVNANNGSKELEKLILFRVKEVATLKILPKIRMKKWNDIKSIVTKIKTIQIVIMGWTLASPWNQILKHYLNWRYCNWFFSPVIFQHLPD